MNFDLYFAERVLEGTKKIEIRKKPQEVNKWIPIVVNGVTLGEMVLEELSYARIEKYELIVYWYYSYGLYQKRYRIVFDGPNEYKEHIIIDKPHFDFYSNYFTGEPIYIYNIKEVRKFNEN